MNIFIFVSPATMRTISWESEITISTDLEGRFEYLGHGEDDLLGDLDVVGLG